MYPGRSSDWYAGSVHFHSSCHTSERHTIFSTEASQDPQRSHSCVGQGDPAAEVCPVFHLVSSCQGSRVGACFYTVVQEDIHDALIRSQSQFRVHRVIDLEILGNVVGADIRQYFTYLHELPELLALPGTYCEQWVREFYASVWIYPDHSYIHYALAGTYYRVTAQLAREVLGLQASPTRIHQLC